MSWVEVDLTFFETEMAPSQPVLVGVRRTGDPKETSKKRIRESGGQYWDEKCHGFQGTTRIGNVRTVRDAGSGTAVPCGGKQPLAVAGGWGAGVGLEVASATLDRLGQEVATLGPK